MRNRSCPRLKTINKVFLLLFLQLGDHEQGELAIDYLYDELQTCSGRRAGTAGL